MDPAWQTSIDRTLRSTEATLESLQERRRHYDWAKHRIDDYLGGLATPHRDSNGFDSLDRTDLGVPPPLPQHRRYRAGRDGASEGNGNNIYGTTSSATTANAAGPSTPFTFMNSAHAPTPQSPTLAASQSVNGSRGVSSAVRDDPTAPLQLVNAQVRGAMLELELEKAKRADSIRQLAYRTTAELGELRSMITQLQNENVLLRKSVRALEGRIGFAPDSQYSSQAGGGAGGTPVPSTSATQTSFSEAGPQQQQQQHPSRTVLLASAVANSGFGLQHDAAGASASLLARVGALESGLARQQQLVEDRQAHTAAVLRDLVKAEVAADMAQVRTLAREAARDSTEELLKLRLSAVESKVQTEVQRVLRAASASETTAQQAQLQCGEAEHRLSAQVQKLNMQLLEWQRTAVSGSPSTSSGSAGAFANQAGQERLLHFERVTEEELQKLRSQLRQLRQDTEMHVERFSQEQKQIQSQLQSKANVVDLRGLVDRLAEEEQQRTSSSSSAAFREQINTVLRPQLQPMQDSLQKLQESAQEHHENAEAWRRQTGLRFAAVEAATKDFREEANRQDQQWSSYTQELRQVRTEMATVQTRTTDALRQCKADLTEMFEARVQATEERLQSVQAERQQQWDAQLRQVQQSLTEQQESAQRTRLTSESTEERLRRVEAAVATMESAVPHSVADVKSRCEALQAVVQQNCAVPLSRVQQDVEGLQRRLHVMDEDKTRMAAVWSQQLADTKLFFEEHVRNSRDMLEQRISHHKDMYEELRGQQSSQRRYMDEQQQLVLEQVKRLQQLQQQQQQQLVLNNSPPVPTLTAAVTAATVTSACSASDEISSPGTPANDEAVSTATAVAAKTTNTDTLRSLEEQVQQALLPQLQNVEKRVEAAERAAASTDSIISTTATTIVTDAIAPLKSLLEELRKQTELDNKEQQLRLSEVEHALSEKVRAVSELCDRVAATAEEQLSHVREDFTSAVTPVRVASSFSTDPASAQHLAQQLQNHLVVPSTVARTLEDVQTQLVQHAQAMDVLRTALDETRQQMNAARTEAEAERAAAAAQAPAETNVSSASQQDVAEVRAEMQTALQLLQQQHQALMERHDALVKQTQHLADEKLAALTGEVDGVKQATKALPQSIQQLTEKCTSIQAAQREQLPTLHKYVQEVLEVVQESQSAALDPLQLKLRTVEERHRKLLASLEEWMAEQAASIEEAGQRQQKKQDQLRSEWNTLVAVQLSPVQESVTSAQQSLTTLVDKVAFLEKQRNAEEEEKRQLREEVRALAAQVVAVNEKNIYAAAAASENVTSSSSEASPTTAVCAPEEKTKAAALNAADTATTTVVESPVVKLQSYVEELDGRLTQLEEQTSDSLVVTAEALGAFGQQLHDVVTRFAMAVHGANEGDGSAAQQPSSVATSPAAALVTAAGNSHAITTLEDIFTYFLCHLQQLQRALCQLQANTVETLEILELHEESTAALPTLQHTVDAIAAALTPLAERVGIDATAFSLQLNSPHHGVDIYPASRGNSNSSMDSGEHDEAVL